LAHQTAIDQRVYRRAFLGEQDIDHFCRNAVPA
jgi:hypothetical protein